MVYQFSKNMKEKFFIDFLFDAMLDSIHRDFIVHKNLYIRSKDISKDILDKPYNIICNLVEGVKVI